MSWLSSIAGDISNAWNSQPTWAKGLEIGAGAVGAGLLTFGAADALGAFGGAAAGAEAAGTFGAAGTAGAGIDFGTSSLASLSDFGSLAGGASGGVGATTGGVTSLADTPGLAGLQMNAAPAVGGSDAAFAGPPAAGGTAPPGAGPVDFTTSFNLGDINQIPAADAATGGGGTASATAAPATAASPAAAPASGGFNWSSLIPSANQIPGAAIAAGGLGYSIYNQNKTVNAENASLQAYQTQAQNNVQAANTAAAPTLQAGETLMQYLQTGTLPPNVQSQLTQATAAAKAQAIANAARNGTSTDPTQNTALAQQLATIDQNAQTEAGNLEQQLFTSGQQAVQTANSLIASGLNSTNLQANLQQSLIALDNQLSLQTGNAITKFAASLAPQGGKQTYTLQPQAA